MKSLEAMTEWPGNHCRVLEDGPLKTHFEKTVVPFLDELCASLTVSGNHKKNFFSQLTVEQKQSIFNGLGTLNTLNEKNRYAEKNHVRELLKKITIDLLLEGKEFHQILDESHPGELLNFLNWISRAIKNGVLDQNDDQMLVKPIYDQALVRIQQWVAMPVTNKTLLSINVRQLGKSFEQVSIFLDFSPMTRSDKFLARGTIVHLCSASLIDMVTEEPDRSIVGEAEENRIVTVGSIVHTLNKAVSEKIITASNEIFGACTALMKAITAIDYFQKEDLNTLYSFNNFLHNLRKVGNLDRKQYALHKNFLDTLNRVIKANK
ncbi:MAG: hypothetical protein JWQ23_1519 [Herminiimonas sp.]|nr:hypothetical protein [Herminiimonas sp.]